MITILLALCLLTDKPADKTLALPDNSKAIKFLQVITRDDLKIARFWYQRNRQVYENGNYVNKCFFIVECLTPAGQTYYIQCYYPNSFDIKSFADNMDDKPIKIFKGRYP